MAAEKSFGAELWIGTTKVPARLSVKPPGITRGTIDITDHDSPAGAMEFMGEGVYDPGDLSVQIHWIPGASGDILLRDAVLSGNAAAMKIVVNGRNGAAAARVAISGLGIVTSYEPDGQEIEGKQTAAVGIKASGVWTQAPNA